MTADPDHRLVGGPKDGQIMTFHGFVPLEAHVPMYTDNEHFHNPTTAKRAHLVMGIYRLGDDDAFVWSGKWV